ncbi:microtubule-associated protein tau-like [Suncus etruscus]|uniref:microtubule-associated protein tau-like n=1 Tax=Suncus etruscus TaxID=109475 RepID=UPI00210FAC0D|nr:microtubule-associated protein tau-like [Suncus etruscus]
MQRGWPGCLHIDWARLGVPELHGGEDADLATPGVIPHLLFILPEGTGVAAPLSLGTQPEEPAGSCPHPQLLNHLLWGDSNKERLAGEDEDGDRDRDIDESSPQDSTPSQDSPNLPSFPHPEMAPSVDPGSPNTPDEGGTFLPHVPAETQALGSQVPSTGGQDTPSQFTAHVDSQASGQESGCAEVDSEGVAIYGGPPGNGQKPEGHAVGEDTKDTAPPEPPGKQPPSRVPQLKGVSPPAGVLPAPSRAPTELPALSTCRTRDSSSEPQLCCPSLAPTWLHGTVSLRLPSSFCMMPAHSHGAPQSFLAATGSPTVPDTQTSGCFQGPLRSLHVLPGSSQVAQPLSLCI